MGQRTGNNQVPCEGKGEESPQGGKTPAVAARGDATGMRFLEESMDMRGLDGR